VKKTVQKTSKSAAKKPAARTASKKETAPAPKPPVGKTTKPSGTHGLDSLLVKQLAAILDETALTEIEYDTGGVRIRVARHHGGHLGGGYAAPAAMSHTLATPAAPLATAATAPVDIASHPGTVKSPMVGVAYILPEPGAAPFVKLGDAVAEGQTLCLIEAMKTFNPVKAVRGGKLKQILIENGAPVEYGEPLMVIE